MIKGIFVSLLLGISLLINTSTIFAGSGYKIGGAECEPTDPNGYCVDGYSCQPSKAIPSKYLCQPDTVGSIFGKIQPPAAIRDLLQGDPTGAGGLSRFLSKLIVLIYSIAGIVLILMLLWGAFDWLISEGNKEKLQAAQQKIIAAIVGIMLFAAAFAIIQVLGKFTGFTFFVGQK